MVKRYAVPFRHLFDICFFADSRCRVRAHWPKAQMIPIKIMLVNYFCMLKFAKNFKGGNLKKLVILAVLTTMPVAFAQNKKGLIGKYVDKNEESYYGMSGCGLGSVLFGETENRGGQILSSTTNGFYSNNTFGMSSGTSNCVPDKSAKSAQVKRNMNMFISANKEALANDIVKQDGETITALGEIMGCTDSKYLGTKLQSRYNIIYSNNETSSVTDNMYDVVSKDGYLFENCKL